MCAHCHLPLSPALHPFALQGCHVGTNALYRGDVVATLDGVPSPQACCRQCTAFNMKAGRRVCTVFNYCNQRDGCLYVGKQRGQNVTLAHRQCELGSTLHLACTRCLLHDG